MKPRWHTRLRGFAASLRHKQTANRQDHQLRTPTCVWKCQSQEYDFLRDTLDISPCDDYSPIDTLPLLTSYTEWRSVQISYRPQLSEREQLSMPRPNIHYLARCLREALRRAEESEIPTPFLSRSFRISRTACTRSLTDAQNSSEHILKIEISSPP